MANASGALEFLIQQNPAAATANAKFDGDTPLAWAALTGRVAAAQVLLKAGVSPVPHRGETGPMASAVFVGHTEIVQLLLKAGAPPHTGVGPDPLDSAIGGGYADIAKILLKAGCSHDFKSLESQWNMVVNAREGCEPIVRFDLDHGVNPDSVKFVPGPRKAVTVQTRSGPVEVPAEEPPAKPPASGVTALMEAAGTDSVETAAALLAHGADPNLETSEGVTALHFAAAANSAAMVRLLLAHHADSSIRNNAGLSPLDEALQDDAKEASDALAQAGARVDLHSANAQKLLEGALREDVADVVSAAISDGWNPNVKIGDICPALVLARYFGAKACEAVLLTAGAAETDEHSFHFAKTSELDTALKPIKCEMPGNVRLHSASETVRVEIILNEEGRPLFIHALDSPDRHLTIATLHALETWVFNKPTRVGKPVQVRLVMPIQYKTAKDRPNGGLEHCAPEILCRATPAYPLASVPQKTVGKVTLGFLVRADGTISDVTVVSSSDPAFEDCALQALKGYRFGPRTIAGQQVDDRMMLTIDIVPPR